MPKGDRRLSRCQGLQWAEDGCQRAVRRNSMVPRVAVSSRGVPESWQEEKYCS